MTAPRLAIVGCGAIAERFHVPALQRRPQLLDGLVFVDPDLSRAHALVALCGGGRATRELGDAKVDGAIVTAPHELHFPIASALLGAGVHVLCEKPLAGTAAEARDLVSTAERRGVQLAVNNTRRLYPSHLKVKELIATGELGALRRLSFEDGDKFDWPLASGALFGVRGKGRGILLDIGAHVVDLACWWLGGAPEVTGYEDDAMGGTEAMATARLRSGGCDVTLRLSWISKLKNGFVLEGERGSVEGGIYDWSTLTHTTGGRPRKLSLPTKARVYADFAPILLDNFIDVISRGAKPLVPGADVMPSLDVIETCYARRTRMAMPWFDAYTKVAV